MSWHSRVKDRRLWDFCDEKHLHKTQEECHWWCKQEWKLDQQEFDTDFLFHHNPTRTHVGKNFQLSSSHIWNTTHNSFPPMLYIHQFSMKKTSNNRYHGEAHTNWVTVVMFKSRENVWEYRKGSHYCNTMTWILTNSIRSKLMSFYAECKTLRITIIHWLLLQQWQYMTFQVKRLLIIHVRINHIVLR